MAEAIQPDEPLRVLLVDADAAGRERLALELRTRGVAVTSSSDAPGALRALHERGADVVLLATPLGESDWIAVAAAIKEGSAPPVLIVLDGTGQAVEMGNMLPADRGPDAVLPRSAGAAEVLFETSELIGTIGDAGPSFPEILVALRARGRSGVIEVRGGGVCTRVLLRDGVPVFAEGGALRETLGRMLLRRGALSEADYVRVIERMTARLIENEATRMGEVLVELGLLTPQDVFDALSIQVREKIIGCFRWPRFEHHFEPLEALPEDVLAYACPPLEALVLAGMREHFDTGRVDTLLAAHGGSRARLLRGAEETALRFHATPAEQRLLREIRGERTIDELRAASPLGAAAAGTLLAALFAARALDLTGRTTAVSNPAPAPSPAPRAPVRRVAPRSEPAQPAPVRPSAVGVSSLSKLRRELARVGKSAPPPLQPADERSKRIEAERAFRQGMQLLEQSALGGAQKAFARACECNDEPEYRMFEAWVQVLSGKDEEARSAARAQATSWARRVLERDRESLRALTILGQIAVASGELDTAERHFAHALRVKSDDRDAMRGMRLVDRRRSEQPAAPEKSAKPEKRKR